MFRDFVKVDKRSSLPSVSIIIMLCIKIIFQQKILFERYASLLFECLQATLKKPDLWQENS